MGAHDRRRPVSDRLRWTRTHEGRQEGTRIRDDGTTGRRVARPQRLQGYDYAQAGAYAVTICTDWRAHLFGGVTDGRMQLNAAGRLVDEAWHELPAHYPHIDLDASVVMPDHVHGVIVFSDGALPEEAGLDATPRLRDGTVASREEEAGLRPAPTQDREADGADEGTRAEEAGLRPAPTTDAPTDTPTKDMDAKRAGFRRHGLSEVVRGFKSFSGRRVNELRGTPGVAVWQRGYYEHVVRNEEDLNRIRQYIEGNPVRWSLRLEEPDVGLREADSR